MDNPAFQVTLHSGEKLTYDKAAVTPHGYDRGGENTEPCTDCPGGVPCRCMTLGLRVLPSLS